MFILAARSYDESGSIEYAVMLCVHILVSV